MEKPSTSVKCEWLTANDVCMAMEIASVAAVRAESCKNEIKGKCCYLCRLKDSCETSCDLLDTRDSKAEPVASQDENESIVREGTECGDCVFYLTLECPREYDRDRELWRKQEACEQFQLKPKG